ncbi:MULTISPECIES: hypothetical protein [Methylophaga]|uniref:hypothetical protein n=1 Tax=Methylophaga TaxID=40222 RepID=UPI00176F0A06|nr:MULTISPECIES: hypothetical protein [Methylophaga]HIC46464.1 hypothetical protein [Methylophaga sp.]
MKIRKLTDYGCKEFNEYIFRLRDGSTENFPAYMLTHPDMSEEIPDAVDIQNHYFRSRYEMGEYLVEIMNKIDNQRYIGDRGLWTWIALFWFEQLCPVRRDKTRKASMPYNYILSSDYKHRYRHSAYITCVVVN